jgi:hypothetical protein
MDHLAHNYQPHNVFEMVRGVLIAARFRPNNEDAFLSVSNLMPMKFITSENTGEAPTREHTDHVVRGQRRDWAEPKAGEYASRLDRR